MKHATITIAGALALAGCSSAEEKLCRAEFDKTLLNPETAKYSGFEAVNAQEIKNDELLSRLSELFEPMISSKGASYYRMKVRAQGELGNEITKWQFCSVNAAKDACFCLNA